MRQAQRYHFGHLFSMSQVIFFVYFILNVSIRSSNLYVHLGVGWLLRELSRNSAQVVIDYLRGFLNYVFTLHYFKNTLVVFVKKE